MTLTADSPTTAEKATSVPLRVLVLRGVIVTVLALAVVTGGYYLIHSYFYVSTDDAFIDAHVTTVGTKLSNTVQAVLVDDNDKVKEGDLLVQIDPRDYEVQLKLAQANKEKAERDFNRNKALLDSHAISMSDLDTATDNYNVTSAQVEQAQLNREYCEIRAPISGRVTRKTVQTGDYIQAGQTLLSIVPEEVFITANFKETQLTNMKKGQPVKVCVDTFPDRVFKGHVDSLQAGTGSHFSLLPPENATGNYVKVVQRVPVKIVFDEPLELQTLLTPGLSVVPEVKVR